MLIVIDDVTLGTRFYDRGTHANAGRCKLTAVMLHTDAHAKPLFIEKCSK